MKALLSALLALSVLAGVAGSASAYDSQRSWQPYFSTGQGG